MKVKFKSLVALSAFLVAGCAAFFSVFGLSQLFAGASLAVIIMASSLEFAKIISVSFLQRYWTRISKTLKTYLSIGVVVLVCITSAGIYGFLSNAYQKTATQYEIGENELSALSAKKALFQKNIDDNKAVLDTKTKRLDQLSSLRTSQETRLGQAASNAERNRVRQDINTASTEIQKLNGEIDVLNSSVKPFIDSVSFYENKMIESKSKNAGASEVGPLKYIATLVGQPMDKVVNWFILLLIFVFDPLAMALVIATNKINGLETEVEDEVEEEGEYKGPNIDYDTWFRNYTSDLRPENMSYDDWMNQTRPQTETEAKESYQKAHNYYYGVEPEPTTTSIAVGLTSEESFDKADKEYKQTYGVRPDEYSEPEAEAENEEAEVTEVAPEAEVIEPVVEEPIIDPKTGQISLPFDTVQTEEDFILKNTSLVEGETIEDANEGVPVIEPVIIPEVVEPIEQVQEPVVEQPKPKTEPIVATGQIKLEDIKEIKAQNRGFSKEIPPPSRTAIQRIGNKYSKKK
jgi:hypothetical protein